MRRCLATLVVTLVASQVVAQEPGNLWDVTTSMEASGMKMPGRPQQLCTPVNAEGPEAMAGNDNRCQMTDVRRSPGRFSYKVTCPDGAGTGEMTYQGRDSYTSVMTMTMGGDTMKMISSGKRVGACDASKVKKQVAALQAQGNAGLQQACAGATELIMPGQLQALSCEAKYKKQLCDRLGTREGFRVVAARKAVGEPMTDSGTLPEAAKFCGVQAEQVRERLCADSSKTEDLEFIGEQCPALAQPIVQRECAGRGYSSPPAEKYRSFCGTYARGVMQGARDDAAAPNTPAPPEQDGLKERAKRLFGR